MLKSGIVCLFLLLICGSADQWGDYTTMTCLSDTDGAVIRVWGIDTAVVVKDVTKVLYSGKGYEVITMRGDTLVFQRPPFRRMDVYTPPPENDEKADSLKAGKPKRHKRNKKVEKASKKTEKWPGTE